ncbi:MAG: hypothetical protein GX896_10815 [Clostridiales bacterium]|nr:hypothetical protein [Clostridiales bacterium]
MVLLQQLYEVDIKKPGLRDVFIGKASYKEEQGMRWLKNDRYAQLKTGSVMKALKYSFTLP